MIKLKIRSYEFYLRTKVLIREYRFKYIQYVLKNKVGTNIYLRQYKELLLYRKALLVYIDFLDGYIVNRW